MRLKRLYIHGFKSFADRVEVTFEHGVTGVVGPNGCGKSNISDAVRWVLGEQSAKQLRGAKMEDVIFSGTEQRRRMAYCEVALTFDNDDRSLASDFSEVCVTRRVYRTGESEYLLNGTACRLKDIIDLFRDTGIGKDGYSIIGQGRIDEILSQRSEDRRLVFEEAAGIVKYKTRKQEAEKRLDNTQGNLDRVTDIVTELEARIEPLRLQSEDARRYIVLRDEQKSLELNVFIHRSERLNARIADLRVSIDELRETLEANEREQASLTSKRTDMQLKLTDREKETAELREVLQELIRSVEAQEGAVNVARERRLAKERERERILADLKAILEGGDNFDARINELEESIRTESVALEAKKAEHDKVFDELQTLEREAAECEEASEDAKERVIRAMNSMVDVSGEQSRLKGLLSSIDIQLKNTAERAERSRGESESLERAEADAKDVWEKETARLEGLKKSVTDIQNRTRESGEKAEILANEMRAALMKVQELTSRMKLLNEMQRDYDGYNHSVKQVLTEARRLNGAGVHGVVANIIHAPQKLERALDMVLGATVQHIVVDSDEDAQRMIEYLKRNRFGRATFLPISSIRGRTLDASERRVLSMRGCVGLASEMVEYEPIYKGVVDSLLGRTVIAEDLTSGIQIQRAGRYQFRLVTLDGDVMHSGGSMTGGSVQSRMTSLLSRERELKEGEETLKALNNEYKLAQRRCNEHEEARNELKRERAEIFDDMHQQEIAVTRAEGHLKAARDELNSHRARENAITVADEQLKTQKTEILSQLEELSERMHTGEGEQDELRKLAQELQKKLSEMRVSLAKQRDSEADLRVKLATAERGFEALNDNLTRLKAQKGDSKRMREQTEKSLSECENEISLLTESAEGDETKLKILKKSLDESRTAFKKSDDLRLSEQAQLQKISDEADELRKTSEETSDRHHKSEMALARAESELSQASERIWEDYELTYAGALEHRKPDFKIADAEKRLTAVKAEIRDMGTVNVAAVEEYRQTLERYNELSGQRDDLIKAVDDLHSIISELTGKMEKLFRAQFEQLDVYFRQTFVELFGGGRAELRLENPQDALNSGIDIVAQPPGKKLQMLSLLSGGERALTAIAILFAMLKLKPTPFCILDEIEAALDDANIDNFAEYLKAYSAKTQFVVVTHRKGTMSRCDALYGVAMEEKGVSKLISVKFSEAQGI